MDNGPWAITVEQTANEENGTPVWTPTGFVNLGLLSTLNVSQVINANTQEPTGKWQLVASNFRLNGLWDDAATAWEKAQLLVSGVNLESL